MSAAAMADAGSSSASRHRNGAAFPGALSLVAGMVDITSWITLGGLFAAHITGNLVVVLADLVRGQTPHLDQFLAIPVFVAGVVFADLLSRTSVARRAGTTGLLLSVQFLLLTVAWLVSAGTQPLAHPGGISALVVGMSAVAAMAVQNALLHLVRKQAPTTAVMTGNVVVATIALLEIALHDRDRAAAEGQWQATWPLLAGFIGGCLLGAEAVRLVHNQAWLLPAAVSLILLLVASRRTNSSS